METEMEMDGMVVAGAIMGCGGNESESDREQPPGLQDETRRDAGLGLWTARLPIEPETDWTNDSIGAVTTIECCIPN
uniref:Uncharacterized protein n=1 Tax=Oryza barthii TaxID=65489 RepID=A0A0D3FQI0_9ORYZ